MQNLGEAVRAAGLGDGLAPVMCNSIQDIGDMREGTHCHVAVWRRAFDPSLWGQRRLNEESSN